MSTQQKQNRYPRGIIQKLRRTFWIITTLLLLSGCGLISSVKDMTDSATQLLDDISDITRLLDSKVENGEVQQEVADIIDGRLETLAEILESSIQNNGGFLFDQANGTIDNVFMNVTLLLDQIKKGILDDSLPALVSQLSSELQQNINLISSNLEDLVVLTFGNTFVLLDKATNSLILIISMVLLGIGIIIFVFILFRKNRKISGTKIFGLVFMCLFVAFFLGIIVYTPFRGYIIAGLDFGEKYEGITLEPKITGVFPETFVIGKSKRVYLYGKHLNLLDTFQIKLKQGNSVKFTFPDKNIIVNSQNKIVLGNFEKNLNWVVPSFTKFKQQVSNISSIVGSAKYMKYVNGVSENIYPNIKETVSLQPLVGHVLPISESATISMPINTPVTDKSTEDLRVKKQKLIPKNFTFDSKMRFEKVSVRNKDLASQTFGVNQGMLVANSIKDFFKRAFNLPEGDFGITVINQGNEIESAQLFSVVNPPPPAPKPDIFITSLNWSNGLIPVAKQQTSLDVGIGFKHPEEVKNEFKVKLTSSPTTPPIEVTVKNGDIASASGNNKAIVKTRNFSINNDGVFTFNVQADKQNIITESNESNNLYNRQLRVKRYVYDVNVQYLSFQSTSNKDRWSDDEYRIKIRTSVTANPVWSYNYSKNGEPGHTYGINQSRKFTNLSPGHVIILYTSGYEADGGLTGDDDYMGEFQKTVTLNSKPTGNEDSKEFSFSLNAKDYKIIGKYTITRRSVF